MGNERDVGMGLGEMVNQFPRTWSRFPLFSHFPFASPDIRACLPLRVLPAFAAEIVALSPAARAPERSDKQLLPR